MRVAKIASTVRIERSPTMSQKQSKPRQSRVENFALSERAESWSLFRATGPVTRTRRPFSGPRPAAWASDLTAATAWEPASNLAEIKRRAGQDKVPEVARVRLPAAEQRLPGQRLGPSGQRGLGRVGQGVDSGASTFADSTSPRRAPWARRSIASRTPRTLGSAARVPRKWLGGNEMVGEILNFGRGKKEQPVPPEVGTCIRLAHEAEKVRSLRHPSGPGRRRRRRLGRASFHRPRPKADRHSAEIGGRGRPKPSAREDWDRPAFPCRCRCLRYGWRRNIPRRAPARSRGSPRRSSAPAAELNRAGDDRVHDSRD